MGRVFGWLRRYNSTMLKETGVAKPFVKRVGGKGKLVPELVKVFPKKFNNYFEPFVGGGALFYEVTW